MLWVDRDQQCPYDYISLDGRGEWEFVEMKPDSQYFSLGAT